MYLNSTSWEKAVNHEYELHVWFWLAKHPSMDKGQNILRDTLKA